jgi:hypothetical protein
MSARREPVIAVFIDAYGWEVLKRRPILDGIVTHRQPLGTVFGYSSTCDPTILTGKAPREHEHFSFFYLDPANSPFRPLRALGLLPRAVTDRARVRNWISKGLAKAYGYTGYFQMYNVPFGLAHHFDYSEKRDLYQPGGIRGGQTTLFDDLRARNVPFCLSDWRRPEAENLDRAKAALDEGKIALAWLFLGGLDGVLHMQGTAGRDVETRLAFYDARLRELVDVARRRYGGARVHVFSDHGMTDVVGSTDLIARVEGTGLEFGRDYGAMYDSTMARFWFLRPGARERIGDVLDRAPGGRWVADEELAAWGCDFPGQRYGQRFWLADPGILIVPSFMGLRSIPGMHGYDPLHRDSVASYSTSAPDSPRPAGLADLHDLVLGEVFG